MDVLGKRFQQLLERYVGFELFHDLKLADGLPPKSTYVALYDRYVLLRFNSQAQADEFFDKAMKATL